MDVQTRDELLRQAGDSYRMQESRVAAIESRSAAFEGYAAAAAGIAAVGAALLSGASPGRFGSLRDYALAASLLAALVCLVLSGIRAYQATAKRFDWPCPNEVTEIVARAHAAPQPDAARLQLLTSLLVAATRGEILADWKLDRFKQATRYFSYALIFVIAAAILLVWPVTA
jgi:hypothetical protein